jgi:tRNA (guanine-N7-)-methyltransferase
MRRGFEIFTPRHLGGGSPVARYRQHVNPLKASFLERRAQPLPLPSGKDVEVELGCADAQFLFARSAARPDIVPLGLEIRQDLVAEVNARAHREGSPVRVVFAHANVDFSALFSPSSLARVYLNFPDPWFKRRHRKRRVLDRALAAELARGLRPGGELFVQSDVWDVALDALAVLEEEPRLANAAGRWSFWKEGNPYGARSRREQGCEEDGLPIWRLLYVSSPRAAATRAP